MSEIRMLSEMARWHTRKVRYVAGSWDQLKGIIPKFELSDFHDSPEEPANPFLRSVVRIPVGKAERRIPVGVVSNTYKLVQHAEVGDRCLSGMTNAGVDTAEVRCELGLTELDEWANLRFYFPEKYSYQPSDSYNLDLRIEAFNSVDGSSRLTLLLGWFRFVCFNGLVIGKTLTEIRDIHNQALDLMKIEAVIATGTRLAAADIERLKQWENLPVEIADLRTWIDETLAAKWGKKAACRVFHICESGYDVAFADPFAAGSASEKPVRRLGLVPGAAVPVANLYHLSQALSWVATRRTSAEERVEWQSNIAELIDQLAA
jgi:hypothetical protein